MGYQWIYGKCRKEKVELEGSTINVVACMID